jgi:hypothetical protein
MLLSKALLRVMCFIVTISLKDSVMTSSITTLSITILRLKTLNITALSIMGLFVTTSMNDSQHNGIQLKDTQHSDT